MSGWHWARGPQPSNGSFSPTIQKWLDTLNQSAEAKRCLWYPVAVSMMNEHPERASALLFARSLRATFLGGKSDSATYPAGRTDQLYAREAERVISNTRGVSTQTPRWKIGVTGSKVTGVRLKNGRHVDAGHVISALRISRRRRSCLPG